MECLVPTGTEMSTHPVDPTCLTTLPQRLQDIQGLQIEAVSCPCHPRVTEVKPEE